MAWNKQKMRLVSEAEASPEILEIYYEIKQALGIPYINPMFQALAAFPEYFTTFLEISPPRARH